MEDQEELTRMRGEVIEKSIEIEALVEEMITRQYFGVLFENARGFMVQFLGEQTVSFRTKAKILKDILIGWPASRVDSEIHLPATVELKSVGNRLMEISDARNKFAHCGKNNPRFDNPKKEYTDFNELHERVKADLITIRDCFAKCHPSKFIARPQLP